MATTRHVQDWYMRLVFDALGNNYIETARKLGVDRSTVKRRLSRPSDE